MNLKDVLMSSALFGGYDGNSTSGYNMLTTPDGFDISQATVAEIANGIYMKVSDDIFTAAQLSGGTFVYHSPISQVMTATRITADNLIDSEEPPMAAVMIATKASDLNYRTSGICSFPPDTAAMLGVEPGTWILGEVYKEGWALFYQGAA